MLYPTSFSVLTFYILSPFIQFTVDESGKYRVMGEDKTTLSSRKVSSQQDSQETPSDVAQPKHSVARMSHSTSQTSTCVGDTSLEGIFTYSILSYYPSYVCIQAQHALFTIFVIQLFDLYTVPVILH